jgi:predicted ribosome quality control (RQC) complex YloA/Tae2 family protein
MGKYSNVILANQENLIVTAAHQVSAQQSSVRPIQTGQPYEAPPSLTELAPTLSETQTHWQQRVNLVPGPLRRNLLKSYRGLSSALVMSMVRAADLDPDQSTGTLSQSDWQRLFTYWQSWLQALTEQQFQPGWLQVGYTVMGWGAVKPAPDTQTLLNCYYTDQLSQQEFIQLRHQISQKLSNFLEKLRLKAQMFQERLHQVERADEIKKQADLLMAYLQDWQPGMKAIALPDFDTGSPTTIKLNPEKNAIQNAQALYKQHQKLKRAQVAIQPLLAAVDVEIRYLEQVEAAIDQVDSYRGAEDLITLKEIRDELVQQQYLVAPEYRSPVSETTDFLRYQTPNGFELLVGRNNRQNDQLTFRLAGPHDLWFHAQEISGSHVLLRLEPGTLPDPAVLQFAADFAAYHSRSRQSKQVPVVYTEPRYVYKPKGAKPGMAIYKQEQIIWGSPERAIAYLAQQD